MAEEGGESNQLSSVDRAEADALYDELFELS
jgi:hypothetical protein